MTDPLTIITAEIEQIHRIKICPDAELDRDLGADPVTRICIATELDEALGIEITDAQLEGWVTVEDVLRTVAGELVICAS